MAQDLELDADPFFKLLTEALRAGPGSAPWRQAVTALREGDGVDAGRIDEYRLLIAARERLESGKEYRSVRAGPGFTRKLMQGLETDSVGGRPRGLPLASLIALAAGAVLLAVLGIVIYLVYPRAGAEAPRQTVEDLMRLRGELLNETAAATFDTPGAKLPPTWRVIGQLPLGAGRGLHLLPAGPATTTTGPATGPAVGGGGLVAPTPVAADVPFAAAAQLRIGRPSESTLFEFFVTTDPHFSPDRGTSAHDLVWLLRGSTQEVLLSGSEQASAPRPAATADDASVSVRILMNRDSAVVECDGRRIWAGPHTLPAEPRYVGVRFLRTGPKTQDPVAVTAIRLMEK